MYNHANGHRLLERKPPFRDRFAPFAFLSRCECAGRSVIPSQIVLSLHLEDAYDPVFGRERLLCKNQTSMSACTRSELRPGRTKVVQNRALHGELLVPHTILRLSGCKEIRIAEIERMSVATPHPHAAKNVTDR